MRLAIAIVLAILAINLSDGSVLAQTSDEPSWLLSLHMFDAQTGWAVSAQGWGGAFSRGAVGSIVRTTDGGLHWKVVADAGEVRAITPLSAWLPGPGLHTIDGGQTWRRVTISVDGVTHPLRGVVDLTNDNDWWVLWGKDLHRSTNGGETWSKAGSVRDTGTLTVLNTTTAWIVVSRAAGEFYLLVTRDGGYTWQQPKLSVPSRLTSVYRSVQRLYAFSASGGGILSVYYENEETALDRWGGVFFYVTRNGGRSWVHTTPVTLPIEPYDDFLPSWTFADVDHGWVTDGRALYVTSDSGRHWAKIQPRLPESPLGPLHFISPKVGWATGNLMMKPFLLKTLDGGRTWTSVPYVIVRR